MTEATIDQHIKELNSRLSGLHRHDALERQHLLLTLHQLKLKKAALEAA